MSIWHRQLQTCIHNIIICIINDLKPDWLIWVKWASNGNSISQLQINILISECFSMSLYYIQCHLLVVVSSVLMPFPIYIIRWHSSFLEIPYLLTWIFNGIYIANIFLTGMFLKYHVLQKWSKYLFKPREGAFIWTSQISATARVLGCS